MGLAQLEASTLPRKVLQVGEEPEGGGVLFETLGVAQGVFVLIP